MDAVMFLVVIIAFCIAGSNANGPEGENQFYR